MELAAVRNLSGVVEIVLVIVGVLAICGGVYKLWLRDFALGAALLIAGIVVLAVAA